MKRVFPIVLFAIMAVSCSHVNKPKKPDNLIPKKEMVNILLDISLLKSAEGVSKVRLESNGYNTESYVFKRHGVDSIQFALSNEYYSYDLDTYLDIYTKVGDSLAKLKTYYEEKKQEEIQSKKKKDTLSKSVTRDRIKQEDILDSLRLIEPVRNEEREQKLEAF